MLGTGNLFHMLSRMNMSSGNKNLCLTSIHFVGIAVDGNSEVSAVKPTILVKRSGKVVELEQEINGMYLVQSHAGMINFVKIGMALADFWNCGELL